VTRKVTPWDTLGARAGSRPAAVAAATTYRITARLSLIISCCMRSNTRVALTNGRSALLVAAIRRR